MARFYGHLKAGKGKGAALRAAARELKGDGEHGHPYYWAPFILVGDWR
jgi:CHAT domain-containing protein